MHSLRFCHLVVAFASLLCIAQASWANLDLSRLRYNFARQLSSADDVANVSALVPSEAKSDSAPSSTPSPTPSSSPSPTSTPSEKPSERPTPSPTESASSSSKKSQGPSSEPPSPSPTADRKPISTPNTPAPTPSSSSESQPEDPSSTSEPTSTPRDEANGSSSKPAPTVVVSTSYHVITMTNSDGSQVVATSTTRTTTTPDLNSGGASETSAMSAKTRNTIIGVVVGVGGAIALGALGLVVWRAWARRKENEESDGLMAYDLAAPGAEKPGRGSAGGQGPRSPFQATLENYHQPTHVNASSNF